VAWKIHSEVALLLGWGRAILLQFAHPAVAAAVADHSLFHLQAWGRLGRLRRTLEAMLTLTFGTSEERLGAARAINAIHDRVHGRLGDLGGSIQAGRPYSARDPKLLLWVHATLLDSYVRTYELYVGRLTAAERDRYCAEAREIAVLLGIPGVALPATWAALQGYVEGMLAGQQIAVTATARTLARQVLSPPRPHAARPVLWLMRLSTAGMLPPQVRDTYGFAWGTGQERAFRIMVRSVRLLLAVAPSALRRWPVARRAYRRPGAALPRTSGEATPA
jgi:uncharacterized protein (DUF2236 family)